MSTPSAQAGRRFLDSPIAADALVVFGLALGLRFLFAMLLADTYDPDEFVLLSLARDMAHGAVPYQDFMFFHPPGILVALRLLEPLTAFWWPAARVAEILLDSATAVLVWSIGTRIYDRRQALAAGVLYGASPLALVTSGRVLQAPLITALGMAGILLLLSRHSTVAGVLAGALLGAAVWVKYPALLFLPTYLLLARSRALPCLFGLLVAAAVLFAPFLSHAHALWTQTVIWQLLHRLPSSLPYRAGHVALFWLLANPLAVIALLSRRFRPPLWVFTGFGSGALFLLPPQTFYHYFLPMVPFAALIGAPLVAPVLRLSPAAVGLAALTVALAWVADMAADGPARQMDAAARFSGLEPTVRLLERETEPGATILADRFEYAYLAGRPSLPYFWNMRRAIATSSLVHRLDRVDAVISTRSLGLATTYPPGFVDYLNRRYPHCTTDTTVLWLTRARMALSDPATQEVNRATDGHESAGTGDRQTEAGGRDPGCCPPGEREQCQNEPVHGVERSVEVIQPRGR